MGELRQSVEGTSRAARFSVFEADLNARELRKHGVRIKLTGQPFHALALLLERPGEVVTRDELRQALWPDESWGEHDQRLNKVINKVREALCDSADTPRFIETIPKIGYRFLVMVEFVGQPEVAPEAPVKEPAAETSAPLPAPVVVNVPASGRNSIRAMWLLGCILITAVLSAAIANRLTPAVAAKVKVAEPVPLTTYVGSELSPSLSPDGKNVAFVWDGGSNKGVHVFVAPVAGGNARQITSGAANESAPVWSPDGQEIAFLRDAGPGRAELWLIHADGQRARKLRQVLTTADQSVTWTKDQRWLVTSQRSGRNGIPALYAISTTDGSETQLTWPSFPEQSGGDLSPTFSPDGTTLAFTRPTNSVWRDIFLTAYSDGHLTSRAPVRLTHARTIINHVSWMPDGRSLVFSGAGTVAGAHHLFRVDSSAGNSSPGSIEELGIEGDHPSVAGSPFRLAFVRTNIEQSTIWRLRLDAAEAQPTREPMLPSTRRDFTTDPSPDGQQLVFSSVRSGTTELWTSGTDGSNLRRLTSIGGMAPRWSPDGKRIAFESNNSGQPDIHVLTLDSGAVSRVTSEGPFNVRPSWSRDGRFIYFCSNRTGRPQIWKVPAGGGDPIQITRHGGQYAVETFDGKSIYYTSPDYPSQLWTTSANGGDERMVLPSAVGYAGIAMAPDGLYYLSSLTGHSAQLDFYRFSDRTTRPLAAIDHTVHRFLSSSRDGRSVFYSQVDRQDTDLMLVIPSR